MTEKNELDLSRRRVLGSLGAVGVASVGAGLGTSAYFSDEETYEGNRLVAGELDMKVDWQEHYSDWSEDEDDDRTDDWGGDETDLDGDGDPANDGTGNFDVVMTYGNPADVPNRHTGLPTPVEPLIAVPDEFVDDFMMNTAVEAYPDEDDDRLQDLVLTRKQLSGQMSGASPEEVEEAYRSQFADVPASLDSNLRTESSRGDPLVQLSDVKPGDFGEVTFSFHLFDNPGYIWLTGEFVENAENDYSEPEAKDPDEDQVADDTEGELLESIRVLVWHDDGDNVLEDPELVTAPHNVEDSTSIELSRSQAIVAEGTLGEVLDDLSNGGIALDADTNTAERDCYPYSTTRHLCVAWWLPVDHANEIQTDSVSFDLGFYTEQCRHNDGSGQAPE